RPKLLRSEVRPAARDQTEIRPDEHVPLQPEHRTVEVDAGNVHEGVASIGESWAADRAARQQRRALDPADFTALRDAGFTLTGIPADAGGIWRDIHTSTRDIAEIMLTLAHADPSVALVSSMHPAVLSYWLATPQVP